MPTYDTDFNMLSLIIFSACSPNQSPWSPSETQTALCWSNGNGQIEAEELTLSAENVAQYGIYETWEISSNFYESDIWEAPEPSTASDSFTVYPAPLHDQWFADFFPEGAWVLPLDPAYQTVGIYTHDNRALWLWGSASFQEDPSEGQTLLVYETPIPTLRFPLYNGLSWNAQSDITGGVLQGLPFYGTHQYTFEVNDQKSLRLGAYRFDNTLRIHTQVTFAPDIGSPSSLRQNSFFAPCTGELLRIASEPDEANIDFTQFSHLQALKPD